MKQPSCRWWQVSGAQTPDSCDRCCSAPLSIHRWSSSSSLAANFAIATFDTQKRIWSTPRQLSKPIIIARRWSIWALPTAHPRLLFICNRKHAIYSYNPSVWHAGLHVCAHIIITIPFRSLKHVFFFQSTFFSSVYKCFLYEQIVVYVVLKMSVLMFEFIDVGCSRQIIIMTIKNASFSTGRQSKRLYRCVPQCTFRRPNLPCTTRRINCRSCFTLTVVLYFVFKKSICRRSKKGEQSERNCQVTLFY